MTELPEGWASTRLDHVAEVKLGRQRSPKNHVGERMRPYLRAANVTWSGLNLSDVKKMNFTQEESEVFELRSGDVLVAEASGSASEVGKPAFWRGEIENCCFQNTLLRVRSYGPLPEYLLYFLSAEALTGRLGDAARGVGIHHLGAARLSSWATPLAPLAEQRRIVASIEEHFSRLDAADNSINRAKRNLRRMARSTLWTSFRGDWPRRRLVELTDPTRPICYGILKPRTTGDLTVPYVEVRSIRNGRIDLTSLHYTTEGLHNEFRRSELSAGDVVLAIRGSFDRAAVVPPELEGANVSRDVARLAPTDALDSKFLAYYLGGPYAHAFFASAARGVGVRGVNIGDLRTMLVPVPRLEEQKEIVTELERRLSILQALTAEVERALRRSAALRRSILEQAFSGELVSHDPSDEPAAVLLERIAAERAAQPTTRRRRQATAQA